MSKITLNGFVLLFLLFLGNSSGITQPDPPLPRRPRPNSNKPLHRASLPALVWTKAEPARFKR